MDFSQLAVWPERAPQDLSFRAGSFTLKKKEGLGVSVIFANWCSMKRLRVHGFIILLMVLVASLGMATDKQRGDCSFQAKLSGDEEIPPVKTKAKGDITLRLNKEQNELIYRVTLTDVEEVISAHLHTGRRGAKGEPIAILFAEPKKRDVSDTLYAEGTIAGYQLVGPLKGQSLDCLLQMMRARETYVNVCTKEHPEGEIRGQIELVKGMKR
jgi:hypothetical protein